MDFEVSDIFTDYWSSFAKNNKPSSEKFAVWPPYIVNVCIPDKDFTIKYHTNLILLFSTRFSGETEVV